MKCRHVKKTASRYVDDTLSPNEKNEFDSHIRSCASCRGRLEETHALGRLFASAEKFPAPYGFAARVLAKLKEKEQSRFRSPLFIRPFFLRAAQVAFALVVMTIGIISGNRLLPERTNPIGQTAIHETFSLNLFQAMPPDSIAGIYNSLMRSSHEK